MGVDAVDLPVREVLPGTDTFWPEVREAVEKAAAFADRKSVV